MDGLLTSSIAGSNQHLHDLRFPPYSPNVDSSGYKGRHILDKNRGECSDDGCHYFNFMWFCCHIIRLHNQPPGAQCTGRKRKNAIHRRRDPGRCASLSQSPISRDRSRRHRRRCSGLHLPRYHFNGRLPARRDPVGRRGLYRNEHLGSRQCPHGPGRKRKPADRAYRRIPRRCSDRHAGRGSCPAGHLDLLLCSDHPDGHGSQ